MIHSYNFKNMNTRQKGYYRDKCIIEAIELFEILTTIQIYYLFFTDVKYGIVKCRERLRILREKGKINSIRVDINEYAIHFVDKSKKYNRYLEHNVNRNWGFLYLLFMVRNKYKYYKFSDFNLEYVFCEKRADGIIGFKNYAIDNDYKYFIIESDRVESNNRFEKVKIYNDIYKNGLYKKEYWFKRVNRFPHILIVCNSKKKKLKVEECVERDNIKYEYVGDGKKKIGGLKFIVKTIDEIKEELRLGIGIGMGIKSV